MEYKIIGLFDNEDDKFITSIKVPKYLSALEIRDRIKFIKKNIDNYNQEDVINFLGEKVKMENYYF